MGTQLAGSVKRVTLNRNGGNTDEAWELPSPIEAERGWPLEVLSIGMMRIFS